MAGYSVTYTVVDQATAQIDKINKRIQQLRAPLEAQAKSMSKFVDVSGLRRVENGLKGIASGALSAANSLSRMVPALGAITGATTLAGIGKLVTDFSHMALELTKTGMVLDETPEKLSGVAQAMRSVGGDAQTAIDGLTELKNTAYDAAIGLNGTASYAFYKAGIAIREGLNGPMRDTIDIQADVFRHLDQIPDTMDRYREAMRMGGKALADTYLQYKAMNVTTEEYIRREKTMQTLTAQRTRDMLKFEESMATLNTAFYSLGATVAGVVAPVLTPMLNDLAKWVDAHQTDIAAAIKGIADALVWLGNNMGTVKTTAEVVAGVFVALWGVRAVSSVLTLMGQVSALNATLGITSGLVSKIALGFAAFEGAKEVKNIISDPDAARARQEKALGPAPWWSPAWLDPAYDVGKAWQWMKGGKGESQAGKEIPLAPAMPPGWGTDAANRIWQGRAPTPAPAPGPAPAARPAPAAGAPAIPLPKGTRDDPLYVVPINGAGGMGGASGGGVGGASYGGSGYSGGGGGGSAGGAGDGRPAGRFGGMAPGAGVPAPGAGLNAPVQDYGGKIDRSKFDAELKANPALREKILRIAANEQGSNPAGVQSVLESMMNRAQVRGTSLEQQAKWYQSEGGYYAQGNMGRGALEDPKHRAILEDALTKTLAGSNVSNYATDNASGDLAARERASGAFKYASSYGGETFFTPGTAEPGQVKRYEQWFKSVTAGLGDGGGGAPKPGAVAPASTTQVLEHPQSSRGYPFPVQTGGAAEKLAPTLPLNTTNYTGMDDPRVPAWVKATPSLKERGLLPNASGAPGALANNSSNAVTGGVDISVTHKNAPADVSVAATKYGTGLNLGAPRVEHQRMGQI
jgi:uncharacterized membrane protein YgcG